MFARVRQMLVKEFIQVLRDPRMRTILFISPVIQLFIFGYAASSDVKNVPTAVYDLDSSAASRSLIDRFTKTGYFLIKRVLNDENQIAAVLDSGEVSVVLRLNHGFEEDLLGERTAEVQLLLDGSDANTASIVLSYAGQILARFNEDQLRRRLERSGAGRINIQPVELLTRAWFNENLESRNYYVPGVICLIVTLATLLLTSMAVVREKEIGTMEQIIVTPIRPAEFILGKTIPFALISLLDVIVVTIVARFWFEAPIRGSLLVLLLGVLVYLMTTLGLGLLISTISETQQQALMSTFFFFFPAILLSGFAFPIANMPRPAQWVTLLNPMRYFLVIIRGVFLKGVGFSVLWPQLAALLALGTVMLFLAVSRFQKTLS